LHQPLLAQPQAGVVVDADGTVHMPPVSVPVSGFLSPEGKAYLTEHLLAPGNPDNFKLVSGVPALIAGYLERQRELFSVTKEDTAIGGVHAVIYQPAEGIPPANRDKVLINLHGGGFSGCWLGCAELESLPITSIGRIKVISVDYRQGPDNPFPAASEDVASVYRELLKTYRPENIGIYGSSAGGMLAGMAVAWFQQHDLPRPGAIAMLNAGAAPTGVSFGGDAAYFAMLLGEARVAPPAPESATESAGIVGGQGYLAGTDKNNPLISPTTDPAVLQQFPPTMIVSGTRSFDLSNAVHTHMQLVKLNVPAELYVWEGVFHGFFYNPDVPESTECFNLVVRFFNSWLGKA
jgi:acetyl esterase/lipase